MNNSISIGCGSSHQVFQFIIQPEQLCHFDICNMFPFGHSICLSKDKRKFQNNSPAYMEYQTAFPTLGSM